MWNDIKKRLQNKQCLFGTMVRFVREPGIANVISNAGFDFMLIDMEHSAYSLETVSDMIRVARGEGIAPIVRPPARERFFLSRIMDLGAYGVMVAMTETQQDAEEIREACCYRPLGSRGVGNGLGQTDFQPMPSTQMAEEANDHQIRIAQIESRKGIENIEAIMAVDGIDAAIIGPNDLADSLGVPGDTTGAENTEAIGKVVEACKKYGKFSGIHTGNLEQLHYWQERGMQLLAYQTDINVLVKTFHRFGEELKSQ